jgi:rare lipoprotein A
MSVGGWAITAVRAVRAVGPDGFSGPFAHSLRLRSFAALGAIIPIVATLAACAPSPFVQNKTQFTTPSRQAVLGDSNGPSYGNRRVSVVRKVSVVRRHDSAIPAVVDAHPAARANPLSYGVASFYTEDEWTASGERFNTHALTAAHPTLPFGTRLRVTNVSNGRSVVVRVNDRGPFIPGRVVDLSGSAAETLGMVERGVVKVKLDVMQK